MFSIKVPFKFFFLESFFNWWFLHSSAFNVNIYLNFTNFRNFNKNLWSFVNKSKNIVIFHWFSLWMSNPSDLNNMHIHNYWIYFPRFMNFSDRFINKFCFIHKWMSFTCFLCSIMQFQVSKSQSKKYEIEYPTLCA